VWQWWQLKYSFFGIFSGTCQVTANNDVPMTNNVQNTNDQDKKEEQKGLPRATHAPLTHAPFDLLTYQRAHNNMHCRTRAQANNRARQQRTRAHANKQPPGAHAALAE